VWVLLPRRMLGRNVERAEIVPVGLDVRPLGDRKSHVAKNRDDLLPDLGDRMHRADRFRARRKRDIDCLGLQPRFERELGEHGAARLDVFGHSVTQFVQLRPGRFSLLRAHFSEPLQELGNRAFLAEGCDAERLQLALVLRRDDGGGDFGSEGCEIGHGVAQF
jgi:hypothetical protein